MVTTESNNYHPSPATELPSYNVNVTETQEVAGMRTRLSHHSTAASQFDEKRVSVVESTKANSTINRNNISNNDNDDDIPDEPSVFSQYYEKYKIYIHAIIWCLMTAYFVSAVVLHPNNGWVPLTALYTFITLKMFFAYVSVSYITRPIARVWVPAVEHPWFKINRRIRYAIGFIVPLTVMLCTALLMPDSESGNRVQRITSFFGVLFIIFVLWATSHDRAYIKWRIVIVGVSIQYLLGVLILKTQAGYELFKWISEMAGAFLEFSRQGAVFVLGEDAVKTKVFAVSVLPGVLFFASFIQIVYYMGGMQWIVRKFAWLMVRLMDTSGAESVVAAASPFVGQGESALLVKPFIKDMTRSEIHSTMCSGFATIAALLTACVMSTPCSLAVSKLRYPEKQESTSKGRVIIPKEEDREANILHAAANGAAQGVHLILLIAGTLLAIISLLALVNALLGWFGSFVGYPELTLIAITKYLFVPFAWVIGIPTVDVMQVADLMATKMFVNEFVAYITLSGLKSSLTVRGQLLVTYALCGFANFASIGIQIGCIGAMAPTRKRDLARLAVSSMLSGTLSTFMTAAIAGLLL
ncbi:Na+ dependent nucleoside transporter C-terminus-domain-containing protein [Syncephalis plumigaleata]|nr:Na+ dependent nucleoside transporter C-terminus-domain-containing protein [Syncephalis plumigaleata]